MKRHSTTDEYEMLRGLLSVRIQVCEQLLKKDAAKNQHSSTRSHEELCLTTERKVLQQVVVGMEGIAKHKKENDTPTPQTDPCACPKCGYEGACALMDELEEGRKYIAAFEQWKVDYFGATALRERSEGKTILKFQLSMPTAASWNGKWTGEDRYYARTREVSREKADQLQESYSYSWNDGWRARVEITQTDSGGAAEVEAKSVGFAGYDWMIDAILEFGEILDTAEQAARRAKQEKETP